ncbi:14995_t:CDS:10, partial [Acaulospora morrowiae]
MEKEGSLLIIGGKGESGSIKDTFITDYVNNDYWYDDTSDGSVDAIVNITNDRITRQLTNRGNFIYSPNIIPLWVINNVYVPPKYAPSIPNIVSLYQTILETQHPVDPENPVIDLVIPERMRNEVQYYRDIRPIFESICKNSWVNEMAQKGHGLDKPGNFLDPVLERKLCDNGDNNKDLRRSILFRVRIPAELATLFEYNGQAYNYFMPPLSGNNGDLNPGDPDTYLTVTREMGGRAICAGNQTTRLHSNDTVDHDLRKPTYSKDDGKTYSFQEMCPNLDLQVKLLNKAALEWCVGGPFYPGIEMTYLAYDKNTFHTEFDFRINSDVIQPGDINAYMALPWQADFNECSTNWWPAQRPDIAIPEENIRELNFVDWTRGFRSDDPNEGVPQWGDMDMVRSWNMLGFIVEKQIPDKNTNAFVEVERGKIYELSIGNITSDFYTLDNLYGILNIALQVELSTIPPYLYAMYSIKPKNNIGDAADAIMYKIRHVAAEEMLHASLVANLITAIGHKPIFYSPDVIPFYPNPLPHFKEGLLMIHLSKADKKNFDTFMKIEEPHSPVNRTPPNHPGLPDPSINFNSIGELYQLIMDLFDKLDKKGEIPYDTQYQLEPGMGYAPSTGTGSDGLIVVKDISEAECAIKLIIDQGEGKPRQADMEKSKEILLGQLEVKLKLKGTIEKAKIQGEIKEDPTFGTIIDGKIIEGIIKVVTSFESEGDRIIERIIEEGKFKVKFENIGEGINFEKSFNTLLTGGNIEENSHYNTFRICKIYAEYASESEYQLWPVIDDPNLSSYTDSKIIATANAFNAAYSYLMILLQYTWRTDNKKEKEKRELVIGGMPALMHGVLRPIATFLAEQPISSDTNAGATFGYYIFTNYSSLKNQLIAAVKEASKAFPDNDKLTTAAN